VARVEAVSRSGELDRDTLLLLLARALDYADVRGGAEGGDRNRWDRAAGGAQSGRGDGQFWRYRDHAGSAAVELMRDLYFTPKPPNQHPAYR